MASVSGSSPCVWGQGRKTICKSRDNRIIPMRVGTSINQAVNDYRNKDHPHACGDKRNIVLPLRPVIGSSPCVWGQVPISVAVEYHDGIIPMRVGTRSRSTQAQQQSLGSSPCVWGQGVIIRYLKQSPRIIPMRVGTSWALSA